MEDLVTTLTRGNVAPVKTVLATVVVGLAVYQVVLMAIVYGKWRPRVLQAPWASFVHRASGDVIVVLGVVVGAMCLAEYGVGDAVEEGARGPAHAVAGAGALAVLAVKVGVLHRWRRLSRLLPLLGLSVFTLFAVTWATSAGERLAG